MSGETGEHDGSTAVRGAFYTTLFNSPALIQESPKETGPIAEASRIDPVLTGPTTKSPRVDDTHMDRSKKGEILKYNYGPLLMDGY